MQEPQEKPLQAAHSITNKTVDLQHYASENHTELCKHCVLTDGLTWDN